MISTSIPAVAADLVKMDNGEGILDVPAGASVSDGKVAIAGTDIAKSTTATVTNGGEVVDGSIILTAVPQGDSGYLGAYADDNAADVAASGSMGVDNDVYVNNTDNTVREYQSGAWSTITGAAINTALGRSVTGAVFMGFLDDAGVIAYFHSNDIDTFDASTTRYLFADTADNDNLKQVSSYAVDEDEDVSLAIAYVLDGADSVLDEYCKDCL